MPSDKKVLIIEAQIKRYRVPFYERLEESLREAGIRLTVAYSAPQPAEAAKADACDLPRSFGRKVPGYWLCGDRLLLQPLVGPSLGSDLVIVDQANKFLLNHLLLPLSRVGIRRVALWGHGEIRQAKRSGFSHWVRQGTLTWPSWWFAYTKGAAQYLESRGFPAHKITVVQNSMDTRELRNQIARLTSRDRTELRLRLGIPATAPVGIFCGAFDPVKDLPFLIEASQIVHARIQDFHLILAGAGPEQDVVRQRIQGFPWIHSVGPRFGGEKAILLAVSDVFLLPGAVGLAILDAFAAGLPLLTTRLATHGPEIEYLEDGANGLLSEHVPRAYADSVCRLFGVANRLTRLRAGAAASAEFYSTEKMAANFDGGIRACLEASPSRARLGANVLRRIRAGQTNG